MNMLSGLDYEQFCVVHMDDLLIFSCSQEEHKEHVRQVFARLRDSVWHVKLSKCEVFL